MTAVTFVHIMIGGEERSQLVGGNVTTVDLRQLDEGAQYEVKVLAIVRNREGPPVSVRITTGKCSLSFFAFLNQHCKKIDYVSISHFHILNIV